MRTRWESRQAPRHGLPVFARVDVCVVGGGAAGTAAGVSINRGERPAEIEGAELRELLNRDGARPEA